MRINNPNNIWNSVTLPLVTHFSNAFQAQFVIIGLICMRDYTNIHPCTTSPKEMDSHPCTSLHSKLRGGVSAGGGWGCMPPGPISVSLTPPCALLVKTLGGIKEVFQWERHVWTCGAETTAPQIQGPKQQTFIVSQFWNLEVQNQSVGRTGSKAVRKGSSPGFSH